MLLLVFGALSVGTIIYLIYDLGRIQRSLDLLDKLKGLREAAKEKYKGEALSAYLDAQLDLLKNWD